jgi:hypothetical protein
VNPSTALKMFIKRMPSRTGVNGAAGLNFLLFVGFRDTLDIGDKARVFAEQ